MWKTIISIMSLAPLAGATPQSSRTEYVQNNALVTRMTGDRTLAMNQSALEMLVFLPDEIRGLSAIPKTNIGNGKRYHTIILIDAYASDSQEEPYSSISRTYTSAGDTGRQLSVDVFIRRHPSVASEVLRRVPQRSSAILKPGTPTGCRLGDACWQNPRTSTLTFQTGRAHLMVGVSPRDDRLCDALALSLEYKIRARDDMMAAKQVLPIYSGAKKLQGFDALSYNGNSWVPLGALRAAGVDVSWDKSSYTATCKLGAKTVTLKCLDWTANVNGRSQELGLPCLLVNRQMVVPIKPVAAALRMRLTIGGSKMQLG